ncbi:MAG TPA: ABC transporter permease [Flexivirga sp.]|uniref:ABC transporter permease n=1 Tax=Flexivirga sp. TaxID=1962927 RepID=UPI002C763ECD|nr:ABC transporter permease [Flexivirga sp.]HWC24183.1 ABC transporter permease [Flexivirga sp.]
MTEISVERQPRLDGAITLAWLQKYGVYAAIAALLVFNAVATPNFITTSNLKVQLFQATPILLTALGMALVIGTEGVDLSVGAVIALTSALLPLYLGYGVWMAILIALLGGAVSGAIGGTMVGFARVQPIVATLALMIGLRGLAVMMNGATAKSLTDPTVLDLGTKTVLTLPLMTWIALAVVLVVAFLMRRTTFGRQLSAIGDNPAASTLAGLPVRRVLVTVYVLSGVFAALAGLFIAGNGAYADPANYGLQYELYAITAVVVGGTPLSGGRVAVLGTVAGTIFMQLVQATLIQHNIQTSWEQMVQAVIIVLAVFAARGRSGR